MILASIIAALAALTASPSSPFDDPPTLDPPAPAGVTPNEQCAVFGYFRYPDPAAGDVDTNGDPVKSCAHSCEVACSLTVPESRARYAEHCKGVRATRPAYAVWVKGQCCPANNPLSSCYGPPGAPYNEEKRFRPKMECVGLTCSCTPYSTRRGCEWVTQSVEEIVITGEPSFLKSSTCSTECRTGFLGTPIQ